MSDLFGIFNPGYRHAREYLDVEKMLVVDSEQGGTGPEPLDLDAGTVVLRMPGPAYPEPMQTPAVPEPDDKDWTFVLERPCAECGFLAADVDAHELPGLVLAATAPWQDVLAREGVRQRPDPLVWSPLEYGCHVRDVLRIFTERNRLIRTEDDPRFANWDQDATALEDRYWEQDPATVASELAAAADANAAAWTDVAEEEWSRPGTRSNGSVFTLDTLGRYMLHDLVHHLHDVDA
ncbi:MAG: DinB family protein [Propionicimonas sp.]|uniref:DinB family protein n=1 Tax=Propionicimonas sp. TaxID=1955623 RepID=UPI003D0E5712